MSDDREPLGLIVTGCYRSGTTLLEKLLHGLPGVCCASQPFPLLYIHVKAAFDASLGLLRRYPLGHLFLEDGYEPGQLDAFLDGYVLGPAELDRLFDELAGYSNGLWTPEVLALRGRIAPGTFWEVFRQLGRGVAGLLGRGGARVIGGKEVLVEELVPHLLRKGARGVVIVRDPRDMIASLNFRERDNLTGKNRPVLYSLRAWRKSVAIALALEHEPTFRWLRYEDLIADPAGQLGALARLVGVDVVPPGLAAGELRDQHGRPWRGNSSFGDHAAVSNASVGTFATVLPAAVTAYVEAACGPEMAALGYQRTTDPSDAPRALREFSTPFTDLHDKFPVDYDTREDHLREELRRLELLGGEEPPPEVVRRWFRYERAYARLRATRRGK